MLDIVAGDGDPCMLAYLPDREFRRWELGVCKSAHRHRGDAGPSVDHVGNRRPAGRAEAAGDAAAAVGGLHPFAIFARHDDLIIGPARLHRKGAPAALLAIEAVAHRDTHRIALAGRTELPAAA